MLPVMLLSILCVAQKFFGHTAHSIAHPFMITNNQWSS